jgi:hypothetical protein
VGKRAWVMEWDFVVSTAGWGGRNRWRIAQEKRDRGTLPPFFYSVKFIVVDKTFFFKEQ